MFFKKEEVAFVAKNDYFHLNDEKIEFLDINAIYIRSTSYTTNSVYEKTDTVITLIFKENREIKLKADTKDLEKYKKLEELRVAIEAPRYKKLHLAYFQNDTLAFECRNNEYSLVFEDKKLFVKYNKAKRVNSIDFEVKTIEQDKYILKLQGDIGKEVSSLWILSDAELFIKLARGVVEYITAYETMLKKNILQAKLYKYFIIFFIPFGINGFAEIFFKTSFFRHFEPIYTLSLIAGMLLALSLVSAPVYYLTDKLNGRKLQRENDFMEGKKSSVKDFDFSNLFLVVLVGLLVYFMYVKVL